PHTFLNYIFINKAEYEQDKINEELLLHEYEHVKQKHSYDILFVEFLQLFFWFNPFLYLIKKSIKLNHEFLADNAVLKTDIEIHKYQELLLKTVGLAHPTFLSSSINYSITKKRLKMMTKSNHKVKRWGFTFLLLPLFAVLLYSFSSHEEVIQERTTTEEIQNELKQASSLKINYVHDDINILINENYDLLVNDLHVTKLDSFESILNKYNEQLSFKERKEKVIANIVVDDNVKMGLITDVKEILRQYGVNTIEVKLYDSYRAIKPMAAKWLRIRINGKKIVINGKATTLEKFAASLDKLTKNWTAAEMTNYKSDVQLQNVPDDFLIKLNTEYKKTQLYKANPVKHGLIPDPPPPPSRVGEVIEVPMPSSDKEVIYIQEDSKATQSEIEEYNSIVKKLNAVSESERIIKLRDLNRIQKIRNKMSSSQRDKALPFPNIPPPPPPKMDTIYTYQRLAKRIQTVPKNRKANIIYLKKLYGDMNASQKKSVRSPQEVFTNIPDVEVVEIVEEPEAPLKVPDVVTKYNFLADRLRQSKVKKEKEVMYLKALYKQMDPDQKASVDTPGEILKGVPHYPKMISPPPPPPPKSPLDHIIDMAKKGAVFYLEGKKISSDQAIKYAKENKSFHLETKSISSQKPSVHISKSNRKKEVIEIIEESGNRGPSVGGITQTIGEKVKGRSKIDFEKSAQEENKIEAYFKNATFKIETKAGAYVTKTYYELTAKEKARLIPPPPPPKQRIPSTLQLSNWSSNTKYGVWIDDERVANSKISDYGARYFVHFNESKLMKNAKNYGKYYYQVNLYSKPKWKSHVGNGKIKVLSSSAVVEIKLGNKIMIKGT
ncbi:M56 family metallopeptidase, partial [Spongiivirga citrea]